MNRLNSPSKLGKTNKLCEGSAHRGIVRGWVGLIFSFWVLFLVRRRLSPNTVISPEHQHSCQQTGMNSDDTPM
jgi:hypothetical protein